MIAHIAIRTPNPESADELREAFQGGVQAMRAAVDDDPFPEWEDTPPQVYLFEDI